MGQFEDALKALRERFDADDLPGEIEVLEHYKGSDLRKKAEEHDSAIARAEAAEAEVKRLKTVPKVTDALAKAGVDFEALRPLERKAIESLSFEGDEPTEEWVAKIVSESDFPMVEGVPGPEEGTEPNAAAIARQAKQAPAGGKGIGTITPEIVAAWPQEKRLRFRKEHQDAWNVLKDGGTVTGIAFS